MRSNLVKPEALLRALIMQLLRSYHVELFNIEFTSHIVVSIVRVGVPGVKPLGCFPCCTPFMHVCGSKLHSCV